MAHAAPASPSEQFGAVPVMHEDIDLAFCLSIPWPKVAHRGRQPWFLLETFLFYGVHLLLCPFKVSFGDGFEN